MNKFMIDAERAMYLIILTENVVILVTKIANRAIIGFNSKDNNNIKKEKYIYLYTYLRIMYPNTIIKHHSHLKAKSRIIFTLGLV